MSRKKWINGSYGLFPENTGSVIASAKEPIVRQASQSSSASSYSQQHCWVRLETASGSLGRDGLAQVSHPPAPTFDCCEFWSLQKSHDFVLGSPFSPVAELSLCLILPSCIDLTLTIGVKELCIINITHVHLCILGGVCMCVHYD